MITKTTILSTAVALAVTLGASTALTAEPVRLSIASFKQKSSWFAYSTRVAELIRAALPAGSTVDAPPKGGGTSNPRLVAAGKFDLAFGMAAVSGWAQAGQVAYKAPLKNLRSLVGGFDQYYVAVVARRDASASDLPAYVAAHPGMKVVLLGKGSAGGFAGEVLLGFSGASKKMVSKAGGRYDKAGSFGVVKAAISSGKSDLWIHTVTRGHPALTEIAIGTKLSFLEPSAMVLRKMAAQGWTTAVLPAGTFKGQDKDVKYPGTTTSLFTSTRMSDKLAYTIVKAICDNQDRFKAVHKALSKFDCATRGWKPENVVLPLHPGAARYFKEKGWLK
ncbi:MAG: TAXI family TRAP transporter solute-binding subunit [Alphaproteobacteria bacterium]|nr:TAXI family TRAP transporter solute-binding subunit [Alphaproteobacteria bacterium]